LSYPIEDILKATNFSTIYFNPTLFGSKQDIIHNIAANKVSSRALFGVQDLKMIEGSK
jgi:hypothetical protein